MTHLFNCIVLSEYLCGTCQQQQVLYIKYIVNQSVSKTVFCRAHAAFKHSLSGNSNIVLQLSFHSFLDSLRSNSLVFLPPQSSLAFLLSLVPQLTFQQFLSFSSMPSSLAFLPSLVSQLPFHQFISFSNIPSSLAFLPSLVSQLPFLPQILISFHSQFLRFPSIPSSKAYLPSLVPWLPIHSQFPGFPPSLVPQLLFHPQFPGFHPSLVPQHPLYLSFQNFP